MRLLHFTACGTLALALAMRAVAMLGGIPEDFRPWTLYLELAAPVMAAAFLGSGADAWRRTGRRTPAVLLHCLGIFLLASSLAPEMLQDPPTGWLAQALHYAFGAAGIALAYLLRPIAFGSHDRGSRPAALAPQGLAAAVAPSPAPHANRPEVSRLPPAQAGRATPTARAKNARAPR